MLLQSDDRVAPLRDHYQQARPSQSCEDVTTLLSDMSITLGLNLEAGELYAHVSETASTEAVEMLKRATERFKSDAGFRDLLSGYAALGFGKSLVAAPSISPRLEYAHASVVAGHLARAGILLRHHYDHGDARTPMVSFMPIPDHPVASNAHLLIMLTTKRFHSEPDFARDLTRYIAAAGQSQHDA